MREEPFGKPVIDALRDVSIPAGDREFAEFMGRLRIVITYASLYGDKAVLDWSAQR